MDNLLTTIEDRALTTNVPGMRDVILHVRNICRVLFVPGIGLAGHNPETLEVVVRSLPTLLDDENTSLVLGASVLNSRFRTFASVHLQSREGRKVNANVSVSVACARDGSWTVEHCADNVEASIIDAEQSGYFSEPRLNITQATFDAQAAEEGSIMNANPIFNTALTTIESALGTNPNGIDLVTRPTLDEIHRQHVEPAHRDTLWRKKLSFQEAKAVKHDYPYRLDKILKRDPRELRSWNYFQGAMDDRTYTVAL